MEKKPMAQTKPVFYLVNNTAEYYEILKFLIC
jgi:hypothetical protein